MVNPIVQYTFVEKNSVVKRTIRDDNSGRILSEHRMSRCSNDSDPASAFDYAYLRSKVPLPTTTRNSKTIDIVDLFCGCGGLTLGFLETGFNVLLGIDHDEHALKTYQENST